MEKVIWKFAIPTTGAEIKMPKGAEILSASVQKGLICIWAICDESAITENRYFETVMTGGCIPDDYKRFIGTFLLDEGAFVCHVFEI